MYHRCLTLCLVLIAAFAVSGIAAGADISVRAIVTPDKTEVGEPVQLQIEIDNAHGRIMTPDVKVDGLQVDYRGSSQSQQMQLGTNGYVSTSKLLLNYEVQPEREGDFTIPALTVVVDGKTLQTKPVSFKVQKASGAQRGGGGGGQRSLGAQGRGGAAGDSSPAKAFAEIDLKKKDIYLGEAVPIEVRLLVDTRIRLDEVGGFELVGDGFTAQKFPKTDQTKETRGGQTYNVVVFRTVLTPSRAGKVTIGPCKIPYMASVPRGNRRKSGFDSMFDEDFFAPFRAFAERQRYDADAPAVEINVKPLPTEGRPKEFTGAVGQFQFDAESSTNRVKAGEPITMHLRVTGEGNFDRVQAPVLVEKDGWQAYDASEKFDPGNEFKNTGTKTFELPVVAQTAQKETPKFAFSFFDPVAGKYVTQTSKPTPLTIEGSPLPPPAAPAATAQAEPQVPAATPRAPEEAKATPAAAVPLRYELGTAGTFQPIHQRPVFWMWQGIAAVGALGLIAARVLRREPAQRRAAALRHERDHLRRELRSQRRPGDFFDGASRVLQLATACATGADPSCVDAAGAKSALAQEDETAAAIDEIFDRRGALVYAGRGEESELSSAERSRFLTVLEQLCGG